MTEKEPQYFKEFRKHIDNNFATKEYLEKKLENYPTKDYLDKRFELQTNRLEQHMTDLTTGFREQVKGVCDQVTSIDEKVTMIDQRLAGMDQKLTSIGMDVFHIKGVLKSKANKKDHLVLEKRVLDLETKNF